MDNIPDIVWTFDWDSLPLRTGFIVYDHHYNDTGRLDLMQKIKSHEIPPVHFHYGNGIVNQIYYDKTQKPSQQYLDFSHDDLESLGYLEATLTENISLLLNLSHRKNRKYEYGCHFYTAGTRNKSTYREGDKWWFVQESEMSCRLNRPRVEKISANRTLYYFDDIPT